MIEPETATNLQISHDIYQVLNSFREGNTPDESQKTLINQFIKSELLVSKKPNPTHIGIKDMVDNANFFLDIVGDGHYVKKDNILSAPTSLTIYPSFVCNVNCQFCFIDRDKRHERNGGVNYKVVDKIIELIKTYQIPSVDILGGEPFLFKNFLQYFLDELCNTPIKISITTNATNLTADMIQFLEKYNKKVYLTISIHGINNVHDSLVKKKGTFQKVLQNLKSLDESTISWGILTVVNQDNFCQVDQGEFDTIFESFKSLSFWVLNWTQQLGDALQNRMNVSLEDFHNLYTRTKKKYAKRKIPVIANAPFTFKHTSKQIDVEQHNMINLGCDCGVSKIDILPNGDVTGCTYQFNNPNYILGNILQDDFNSIWFNKIKRVFFKKYTPNCHHCSYNDFCRGCPGYSVFSKKFVDDRCYYIREEDLSNTIKLQVLNKI